MLVHKNAKMYRQHQSQTARIRTMVISIY